MNPVLTGVLAYIALQLVLGYAIARRVRGLDAYFVAGRQLGAVVGTFTILATWFGAETCVGSAGAAYTRGLSATLAEPFGYGGCLLVMGAVFAIPLHRRGLTTLPDLFRQRYGVGVERLAALMMIPSSLLWAAAQMRAFGQVISSIADVDLTLAIGGAAGVTIGYTMLGGFLADVWTDVVQGVVLIAGLLVLGVVVLSSDAAAVAWDALPASHLDPSDPARSLWDALEMWAVPVAGSVVAQELIARVVASRTGRVARRACLSATVLYVTMGTIPVALGLVGARLATGLEDPERVLIVLSEAYLPTALHVLFAGALISAILSTVDSTLLVCGTLLTHNLVMPLRPALSEAAGLRVARLSVLGFGALAYGVALSAEGVYGLVEEASSLGSSGLFVVLCLGLFTRLGGKASAAVALVAGLVVHALGSYRNLWPFPYLIGLGAAAGSYLVLSRAPKRAS